MPVSKRNSDQDSDEGLTNFARPGSPVRSYDGLCGNNIGSVLVTSPNMHVLYEPPLQECRVRLRKDWHFGRDDPLYYPQPFHRRAPHLSVIRLPSPNVDESKDPFAVAWTVPTASHFIPTSTSFCTELGSLQDPLLSQIGDLSDQMIQTLPTGYEGDLYLRTYSAQLVAIVLRLQVVAPMKDLFLRFRCAQRIALELDARIRWLAEYRAKFEDVKTKNPYLPGNSSIMGAFTDDLDVVESLYRSRIPVYYLRPFLRTPVRVENQVPFIKEYSDDPTDPTKSNKIRLHNGVVVDFSDATPSHRVVFTGLPRNPERYLMMAQYINSILEYPSYLGSERPRNSALSHTARSGLSSRGLSIRHSAANASRARQMPYHASKKGIQTHHNSFLPPSSPLMPPCIESWRSALAHLAHHDQSLPPPDGVNRGFVLPPAEMFITTGNPTTATALFRNWLKLREVLIYRLSATMDRYTKKQWRDMLTFDEGNEMRPETRTGKRRLGALSFLKAMMNSTPLDVRIEDLPSAPIFWRSRRLDCDRLPSADTAKEILWELQELNFRQDLAELDRHLDGSGMVSLQRNVLLDGCWTGTRDYVNLEKVSEGFACIDAEGRERYVKALHKLMMTWTGPKPALLLAPFPTDVVDHEGIERELAHYYALSFFEVFGRAASIPYRLH
ncbi:hypothetical protein VNI00_014748 [Paramarasmius palmivorus]|uniref:Uncharacterized protein n=1 Tax=Paramarasmius palmivorus TaxID=297713 RepID=A0AAW0BRY4_9AGAR